MYFWVDTGNYSRGSSLDLTIAWRLQNFDYCSHSINKQDLILKQTQCSLFYLSVQRCREIVVILHKNILHKSKVEIVKNCPWNWLTCWNMPTGNWNLLNLVGESNGIRGILGKKVLYSLHNGLAPLHKYKSMERQRSWPDPRVGSASPVVRGAFRSAVFWSVQLGRVLPQHWRFPPASGGRPQVFYLLTWWLGLLSGTWGGPNKRNVDGAEGIFCNAGRVWASALRPYPPWKRLCAKFARSVGRVIDNWLDPRDTATCDTTCVVDG